MTTFTHMLFDRGQEGEEEMRGIIDYSGEKSFVSFITHAGNGSIIVAVTESGAAAVKCLQTTKVIRRCESSPGCLYVKWKKED